MVTTRARSWNHATQRLESTPFPRVCRMYKARPGIVLAILLGVVATPGVTVRAQNFGGVFQRKQIVLVRKLPPTGHIDGSTFMVKVAGAVQGDVVADLKSTLESLIVSNDPRLRSVTEAEKPDAVIRSEEHTSEL